MRASATSGSSTWSRTRGAAVRGRDRSRRSSRTSGLANVPDAEPLLRELRRAGRELVATHVFYPEPDEENRRAAREHGLEELLVPESAFSAFAAAGWDVEVEREQEVAAGPTPASALIDGVRIDALPAAPTRIAYCVLVAR